ncbi:PEP-CTERM sorting domain-containing protein [Sphingopyxis sp.]|uniref:PEP-CTERM sorting domain-containing protein n=1 Tax=Sphingopyxis sp. TaxID=1908224 RepID=UPI0035AF1810
MEASEGSKPSRYRTTRIALILGVLLIGFTRLEDRAILGIPGQGASAMAAMAIPPSEEVDDGSYADEPDAAVPIAKATRLPRNRVRRALRDRDFATIARRDGPVIAAPSDGAAAVPDPTGTAATEAFAAAPAAGPPVLALATPALGPIANNVFSASTPPPGTTSSSSGGSSGGGTSSGGTTTSSGGTTSSSGGTTSSGGDPNQPPAVPEPATWLSLILGLFGVGMTMRLRRRAGFQPAANA